MNATIIKLPGSLEHTQNACALALINNRSLLIKNPYPKLNTEKYNAFLSAYNTKFEYSQEGLRICVDDNSAPIIQADDSIRLEIDDPVAIVLASKAGNKIKFRKDDGEDYQRKKLILRRLGFNFSVPARDDERVCDYDSIIDFKPHKVKYNFLESNYYLASFIYRITAICNCKIEVMAKFDVSALIYQSVYPLKLSAENMVKKSDEDDELQKRLARLKKNQKSSIFHFTVTAEPSESVEEIKLPADLLLTAYSAIFAALNSEREIKIIDLNAASEANQFCAILSRINGNCTFQKNAGDKSEHNYCLSAHKSELTGKKIDQEKLRQCPLAFGPLALAASLTAGKTIIRGLPESSSLWRDRIGAVAEILISANVRVGEIEDGVVIESPLEYADIKYKKYADPYLQLFQFCAAMQFNSKPLTTEYFDFNNYYPDFHTHLNVIKSNTKLIAS